jgi:hypothetical protein
MCQFSSAQELGLDVAYPWVLVTTTVLIYWIREAAGLRYIYATARGERFVEKDPRCVEHRSILCGCHGDRRAGEDRKKYEHGVGVIMWRGITNLLYIP